MKNLIGCILGVTILVSCNNSNNASAESLAYSAQEESASLASKKTEANLAEESSALDKIENVKTPTNIIKNANVQFQVQNIEVSHKKIAELLKENNSYFAADNSNASSSRIDNDITIRVPVETFEKLLEQIMKESVYTNFKNVTVDDVTAEFVDIEARLKTKKEIEQRYVELLKQAKSVKDILEVENSLRVIREEIEVTEGRLKLMKDQVSYSTITLNIYQNLDFIAQPQIGFTSKLKEAFVNGWHKLISFTIGLMSIWPFLILIALAVFYFVRRKRNSTKRF